MATFFSGLCNFSYVQTKEQKIVTPLVIKNCKKIADRLGTKLSECSMENDSGTEFSLKEFSKHFKSAKNVAMGPICENKNRHFPQFFSFPQDRIPPRRMLCKPQIKKPPP